MNTGGNGTHSHLFNPSLKPTHTVIPYQDIVQVVCKKEYYYSFLHKNYTQLVVQLLPFFCLLFALSTLGVAIKVQRVFLPQSKIAGSRKSKLPRCTMDIRICLIHQLPVRYYDYGTIGVANHGIVIGVSQSLGGSDLQYWILLQLKTIRLFGYDLLLLALLPHCSFV